MTSPIIDKVNTFIRRVNDHEIILEQQANTRIFVNPADENDKRTLSEYLVDTTWKYEIEPNMEKAIECLHWINRAYYYGLVKENVHSLLKKFKIAIQ